jgi:hypothetical protein
MVLGVGPEGGLEWICKPTSSSEMDAVRSGQLQSQNAIADHLGWDKFKVSRLMREGTGEDGGPLSADACAKAISSHVARMITLVLVQ